MMTLPMLRGLGYAKAQRKTETGSVMMMVMTNHMMCHQSMIVCVCWVVERRLGRAAVAEKRPGKKIGRKVAVRKALLVVSVGRYLERL
jgi:hypothetical protein